MVMIEVVTPAAVTPISTADAKAHLRVDHGEEDTLIDRLVLVAADIVRQRAQMALTNTTYREHLTAFPAALTGRIRPQWAPLGSVDSIKYYDADDTLQTWDSAEYDVLTAEDIAGAVVLAPGYTWPAVHTARHWPVQVQYVAGWGATAADIPDGLLHAVYLALDDLYRYRGPSVCVTLSQPVAASLDALIRQYYPGTYP